MEEISALECLRRDIARIQKGHETQLIVLEVLVYPHTNKRAHTPGCEQSAYSLVCLKITSFLVRDSKRMLLIFTLRSIANIKIKSF